MHLEDVANHEIREEGSVGPVRFLRVGDQEVTAIEGPFRVMAFNSGPFRSLFVDSENESGSRQTEERKTRGRSSSNEHVV